MSLTQTNWPKIVKVLHKRLKTLLEIKEWALSQDKINLNLAIYKQLNMIRIKNIPLQAQT